jgi:hypothetical protein
MSPRKAQFRAPVFWVVTMLVVVGLFAGGFVWLLKSGQPDIPPIAQGLAFVGASDALHPNTEWTARLHSRFPIGSDTHGMVGELLHEGFSVDPDIGLAKYSSHRSFPCVDGFTVRWTANSSSRITSITGYRVSVCP